MPESKESIREKLIVSLIQTLFFGMLLSIFGYLVDRRLEEYKYELADQSEKTKILLASLAPDLQLRRKAYTEYRQAARHAVRILELYYYKAEAPPRRNSHLSQIEGLRYELGIGSGGSRGSWATHSDAVNVVENMVELRLQYEDVASEEINAAVDTFVDMLINDLKARANSLNDNAEFDGSARKRLYQGFTVLNVAIKQALGVDQLPVK